MMLDIFSSFDPASFLSINNSTTLLLIFNLTIVMIIQVSYWMIPMRSVSFVYLSLSVIKEQLMRTFSASIKGSSTFISCIFMIIIVINLIGLVPYMFSLSSHLIFTLALGLPMWASFISSSFIKDLKASIAHFLPDGAPDWLNPFLILIETTSILVRPITLSFRLAANMSAGHIVLGLISIYAASSMFLSTFSFSLLLLTSLGYVLFEVAICFIQAYIFCLLLSLYTNDHAH